MDGGISSRFGSNSKISLCIINESKHDVTHGNTHMTQDVVPDDAVRKY